MEETPISIIERKVNGYSNIVELFTGHWKIGVILGGMRWEHATRKNYRGGEEVNVLLCLLSCRTSRVQGTALRMTIRSDHPHSQNRFLSGKYCGG